MQTLVAAGVRIEDLEADLSNRPDKTERAQLKELKKTEKNLLHSRKRPQGEPKKNKHFFGDANAARNASPEELQQYNQILEALNLLYQNKAINKSTYDECKSVICDLQFAHAHNQQICQELSLFSRSNTYGPDRLPLHVAGHEAPFELKAGLMLSSLVNAYNFSVKNNLLADFFTHGLGAGSGCLEAHIRKLENWHKKMRGCVKQRNETQSNSTIPAQILPAKDAVSQIIEDRFEQIREQMLNDSIEAFNVEAQRLANEFNGEVGCDGKRLSCELFQTALIEASGVTFDFDPDSLILANHASYLDITQVQMASGSLKKCRIQKSANDGNCGFTALGSTRAEFIKKVLLAYKNGGLSNQLRQLIEQAMHEANTNSIDGWANMFSSPGYWMNETHLAIYAELYHVTIHAYALNHETNTFVPVQTFNEGQVQQAHIVGLNLEPVLLGQAGPHMSLNHYDALHIEQSGTLLDSIMENLGIQEPVGSLQMQILEMSQIPLLALPFMFLNHANK